MSFPCGHSRHFFSFSFFPIKPSIFPVIKLQRHSCRLLIQPISRSQGHCISVKALIAISSPSFMVIVPTTSVTLPGLCGGPQAQGRGAFTHYHPCLLRTALQSLFTIQGFLLSRLSVLCGWHPPLDTLPTVLFIGQNSSANSWQKSQANVFSEVSYLRYN